MAPKMSLILCGMAALAACEPQLGALDLVPPRVIWTSIPPSGEVSTTPQLEVHFSEALDPATVEGDVVVVLPHRLGLPCTLDFSCGGGRCYQQRCQYDPVSPGLIRDLLNPPLSASRRRGLPQLRLRLRKPARLEISTRRPLAPHRLHTLVLTSGMTDLTGNPLAGPSDGSKTLALRQDFRTASASSGRPTVWLRSPAPGATGVPTNLDRVVIGSSEPLTGVGSSDLWLDLGGGRRAPALLVQAPTICQGRRRGTCHVLRLTAQLPALSVLHLRAGATITDATGQPVMPPGAAQAFASGSGPDTSAPAPAPPTVRHADGCVVIRVSTKEPTDLHAQCSWGPRPPAAVASRRHEIGLRLPAAGGEVHLVLRDLAGNQANMAPVRSPPPGPPGPVITEVLANPAGPEPAQEWVELYNPGDTALDLLGYTLGDNDDGVGVNTLPAAALGPGRYAVVVGKGYTVGLGADPPLASGALLVRLDRGLGAGGLANTGEALALRDPAGRLVSAYGNHHPVGSKASNGRSVERISAAACDVRLGWRPSAEGASTPGGPAAKVAAH